MRIRGLVVLTLGVVLAGGAVMVARTLIDPAAQPAGEAEAREIGTVVVANADIPFGAHISYEVVRLQDWPLEALPPEAFLALDELLGSDAQEPRRARRSMVKGEPLVRGKVSEFGERVTIADAIDPEKRVMTIRVDDVSGVGGFVTPGDRVDVVMIRQTDGNNNNMVAATILQDITVRAIDQISDEDRDKPNVVRSVTVEVSPEDTQRLALAQQAGRLSLSLRNGVNRNVTPLRTVDVNQLVTRQEVGPNPAPIRRQPTVTVNRGGTRTSVAVGGS
jgi:pilus assembly protein CpaB